jgi:REP element-mobilizing transposase RayT
VPDHIHIFIGLHPKIALSDLVRDVKSNATAYVKEHTGMSNFVWQEGFGAFAHSHSQKDEVVRYIINQEEHHRKKSFKEEYIYFLKSNNIEYDERYIFHEPM